MKVVEKAALLILLLLVVVGTIAPLFLWRFGALEEGQSKKLKRFSSYDELESFIKTSLQNGPVLFGPYYRSRGFPVGPIFLEGAVKGSAAPVAPPSSDYSTTNVQVEGVDEADIVKTDGEYIYVVSGYRLFIVKAYPPEEATVLSRMELNGTVVGIFINGDKLVVFVDASGYPYEIVRTYIKVYNVSDREKPVLTRDVSLDGWYFDSRMIGDYAYAVIDQSAIQPSSRQNNVTVVLPKIRSGNHVKEIHASEIYYSDTSDYLYTFTTIVAINVQNDEEEPTYKTILLGAASNLYVSLDNIYVAIPKWTVSEAGVESESTIIYRAHMDGREIEFEANGEVPGYVLNQFSMDEHEDYFRIATTTGQWSGEEPSRNNVYILNMSLSIVGMLEDLAPGEKIYSARFMGDRCYLVTFRKVDPLFVVDLKDPRNPTVLGQLKITGYSDYMHPYDENHIIGIGKETIAAEEGDFAWYQGVKISLFDVSEVEKPKEIAKYIIGDRGTDSPVLGDHHALLFDKSKNLLVMPVLVAEIDEEKYLTGVPPNTYGDYVWQGAYVFNISLGEGLVLKGRITHLNDDADLMKSGDYFSSPYSVKRSLYIGSVLYTFSDNRIKMNSLDDLDEINAVDLP